jgi:hypothetical protein
MAPTTMHLRHLAREASTTLELALVRMAPNALIEKLASVTGLLTALQELPLDTDALRIWATQTCERAKRDLAEWSAWEEARRVTA